MQRILQPHTGAFHTTSRWLGLLFRWRNEILNIGGFKVPSTIGWKSVDFYLIVGISWHEFLSKCICVQLEINVFVMNLILFEKTTCPEKLSTSTLAVIPKQGGNPHPSGPWSELQGQFRQDGFAMRGQKTAVRNVQKEMSCQTWHLELDVRLRGWLWRLGP